MNDSALSRTAGIAAMLVAVACHSAPQPMPGQTPAPAPVYDAEVGPMPITETLATWHDAARNRDVPVKIYAPASADGPFPVIVFSHGLGSSRQGYVYLGREWASRGFVSIHPQHFGTDSEVLRTRGRWAMFRAPYHAQEYVDRPLDISFVLDELERRHRSAPPGSTWAKVDLTRVGVAGHSLGAHTALTIAGMVVNFPGGPARSFRDRRVNAALILSSPTLTWSPTAKEFTAIDIPTMFMSGTKDTSWFWQTSLKDRRFGFDSIRGAPRYFLSIDRATHGTFADGATMKIAQRNGRLDIDQVPILVPRSAEDQRQVDLILGYSDAFWDAYLRRSPRALTWLTTTTPVGAKIERGE